MLLVMFGCAVGYFTDVTADFHAKMPVISAVAHCDTESYRVHIIVNNPQSVETSRLLSIYSQLDPRVRPLVIAFRYWAKVCTVLLLFFLLFDFSLWYCNFCFSALMLLIGLQEASGV